MKTCVMTREDRVDFNPFKFVAKLKTAGFRFISDRPPFQLAEPFERIEREDGTILWTQGDLH